MSGRDALAAMMPMGGPGYEADQDKLFGLVLPLVINGCAGELVQPFIASRDYRGMRKALCTQYLSSEAITTLIARLQDLVNNYEYVDNGHVHIQDYLSFLEYCWRLLARHTGNATDERIKTYTIFRKLEHVSWLKTPISTMEANDAYCTSLAKCIGFIIQKIPANQKNKPRKTIQISSATAHLENIRNGGGPPDNGGGGGGGGGISAFKQKIKGWTREQLNIPENVWKSNKYSEAQKTAIKAERKSRGKQQQSPGKKWMKQAKKAIKNQKSWKKEKKEMTARIASLEAESQNHNGTNGDNDNGGAGGGPPRPPYAAPSFQRS